MAILSSNLCVYIAHSLLILYDFVTSTHVSTHQNKNPYDTLHFANNFLYAGESCNNGGEIHIFKVIDNEIYRVQVLQGHKKGISHIGSA